MVLSIRIASWIYILFVVVYLVLPKCGPQLVGRLVCLIRVMFLVRELSFRFCYIVLFGHDHCRRTFISRFNKDRRVSLERRNRHQLRFRQITHTAPVLISYRAKVFQLFQYFIYILILARWIPGRFGRKVFFGFG